MVDVVHASPHLIGRHFQIIDGLEQVTQQAMHDGLQTLVAALGIEIGSGLQQILHFGGVENFDAHGFLSPS
ncbi:hypothetical protein SDC9_103854 [bioreactor metagenome]|uniref:Uncharacterized protein n=1 Tax=bioreactor metagenome TaxID=1076179 RepID=A0A645AW63_9ZZZZ